jgi:hypothetical protein
MLEGQTFTTAVPRPPIALLRALPAGPLARKYQRLKELADLFAAFDRDDMEAAVDLLLAQMDADDGDPDVEPNGDELDGGNAEDEEGTGSNGSNFALAGCPISDPPEEDDADTGIEDDPAGCDPEEDFGLEELGEADPVYFDDRPIADPAAHKEHLARIRRDRCYPLYRTCRDWRTGYPVRELRNYELLYEAGAPLARNILRRKRGVPASPRP